MKTILKNIRVFLKMSQAEFADKLSVSFATINRWENGHAIPNKLAQTKIFELCKDNNVPVYDMTISRIKNFTDEIIIGNNRVLLYHGSKSSIEGAIAPISREHCDFGKGFYMGTDPSQALTLICDYDKSKLYIVSLDTSILNILDVPANIEWAMLVAFHRGRMDSIKESPLYQKYHAISDNKDLIIGCIANDRMFML